MLACDPGGHIQCLTCMFTSSLDEAFPFELSAFSRVRGESHEGGDLTPVELSEFWYESDKRHGCNKGDSFLATENIEPGRDVGVVDPYRVDFNFNGLHLQREEVDGFFDAFFDVVLSEACTVFFSGDHLAQGFSPQDELFQFHLRIR